MARRVRTHTSPWGAPPWPCAPTPGVLLFKRTSARTWARLLCPWTALFLLADSLDITSFKKPSMTTSHSPQNTEAVPRAFSVPATSGGPLPHNQSTGRKQVWWLLRDKDPESHRSRWDSGGRTLQPVPHFPSCKARIILHTELLGKGLAPSRHGSRGITAGRNYQHRYHTQPAAVSCRPPARDVRSDPEPLPKPRPGCPACGGGGTPRLLASPTQHGGALRNFKCLLSPSQSEKRCCWIPPLSGAPLANQSTP